MLKLTALVSCAAAAALLALLRGSRRAPILLALLPIVAIYILCPALRVYSVHGMLHTGFTYHLLDHGAPPSENPFFAGEPLLYPWLYHGVVALLSGALQVAPSWIFALLNLLCLPLTCWLLARISRLTASDPTTAVFAVFLALFGSFSLEIALLVQQLRLPGYWSLWGLPLANKYLNINPMPIGVLALCWGIDSLLRALSARGGVRHHLHLAGALLACGLFYPFSWLSLGAMATACVGHVLLFRPELRRAAWRTVLVLAVTTVALLPYLWSVTAGKTPESGLLLATDLRSIAAHAVNLAAMLAPLWILILWQLPELRARLRRGDLVPLQLIVMSVVMLLVFTLVRHHSGTKYKFRAYAVLTLSMLAAPSLALLHRRHRFATIGVVALLLVPVVHETLTRTLVERPLPVPFVERGADLHHRSPEADALYRWIATETPPDAVLVDTRATIPVFGRRSTYVPSNAGRGLNGFGASIDNMLTWVYGHPPDAIARRHRVVDGLFGRAGGMPAEEVRAELAGLAGHRPVFAVARDAAQAAALARHAWLRLAGGAGAHGWAVFAVEPDR